MVVGLMLHTPPVDPSDNVVQAPVHILGEPVILPGAGVTVTTLFTIQPEPNE
jgi:hypothetical protein